MKCYFEDDLEKQNRLLLTVAHLFDHAKLVDLDGNALMHIIETKNSINTFRLDTKQNYSRKLTDMHNTHIFGTFDHAKI